MAQPLRQCNLCGQSFWSTDASGLETGVCPGCESSSIMPPPPVSTERPKFVALSALPPGQRLRPREGGQRPGLMVPRRLQEMRAPVVPMTPIVPERRVEPPPPESAPPAVVPVATPAASARQLGFNCPSCYTVLVIKDPENYDGRAAPCPFCAVTIIPPRIAPPSPFTLIASPQGAAGILPPPRASKWKPFGRDEALPARQAGEVPAEVA